MAVDEVVTWLVGALTASPYADTWTQLAGRRCDHCCTAATVVLLPLLCCQRGVQEIKCVDLQRSLIFTNAHHTPRTRTYMAPDVALLLSLLPHGGLNYAGPPPTNFLGASPNKALRGGPEGCPLLPHSPSLRTLCECIVSVELQKQTTKTNKPQQGK